MSAAFAKSGACFKASARPSRPQARALVCNASSASSASEGMSRRAALAAGLVASAAFTAPRAWALM